MSWNVACFCGQSFRSPLTACPKCGRALPAEMLGSPSR
jgi:hypothetical protein